VKLVRVARREGEASVEVFPWSPEVEVLYFWPSGEIEPDAASGFIAKLSYGRFLKLWEGSAPQKMEEYTRASRELTLKLVRWGHTSTLEFVGFCIYIGKVSRVLTHQLVRTRLFSFLQKSHRRVKMGEVEFVIPDELEGCTETLAQCARAYFELVERGVPVQEARYVLPGALATEIVVAGNLRQWVHYLSLRLGEDVQPEHRAVAEVIREKIEGIIGKRVVEEALRRES